MNEGPRIEEMTLCKELNRREANLTSQAMCLNAVLQANAFRLEMCVCLGHSINYSVVHRKSYNLAGSDVTDSSLRLYICLCIRSLTCAVAEQFFYCVYKY